MMKQTVHLRPNGVKVYGTLINRTSPGESVLPQQGTLDRQPVTACNIREETRIATWNVRTMYQPGKFECIQREASRLKIDILGLAEVRWTKSGTLTAHDHVIVYSGHQEEHKNGVNVLLTKQVAKSIVGFHALSDRILIMKIASKSSKYTHLQAQAQMRMLNSSTMISDIAHKKAGGQGMTINMGGLNAKIGNQQDPLVPWIWQSQ